MLQVAGEAEGAETEAGAGVEREGGGLHPGGEVVADGFAVLPFQHVGTETGVGETLDGVAEGVLGGFEGDEVGFGGGVGGGVFGGDFVGVVECGSMSLVSYGSSIWCLINLHTVS